MHKTICHEIDRTSESTAKFNYDNCLATTVDKYSKTSQSDLIHLNFLPYNSFIAESVRSMADRSLDGIIEQCVMLNVIQKNKQSKQIIEKAIKTP
jgi:hypothetical protein